MRRAYETGKPQDTMLHTIRLGADLWRQYTIRFDPERIKRAARQVPQAATSPRRASDLTMRSTL